MNPNYKKIDFLIIEDDYDTIYFLKQYLESQGYTCESARDVDRGLKILKNIVPSVILLDILLPNQKGYKLIDSVKSNPLYNEVLIYFLTAIPRPKAKKKMVEYDINGVISKPFNLEEFEALFKILNKR
ncbi:MAG: two-component system response regulator [Promethearchaeota archaeon]